MTFAQWRKQFQKPVTSRGEHVAIAEFPDDGSGARPYLYILEDYRVSSVSGGAIWLVPRERQADEPGDGQKRTEDSL